MITTVAGVGVYVRDELAALEFYTNVLGFQPHTYDALGDYLDSPRWITVTPQEQPELELRLQNPLKWNGAEEGARMLATIGYSPLICLETKQLHEKMELWKERGVIFLSEPKEEDWGIQAVFQDLDGNKFCLVQQK
ncbi:VOC family protein [Ectobacillus ponti]|uniref:VOC family protein n=1 Tax=Ectobacillus ponti TaxID=2961894 RepID=A0AA42BNV2_9BACI|nr:VOC family protein [Ectobacillus ponti]MCP8966924.1 VOC family protein [Ectobacillus ponti]